MPASVKVHRPSQNIQIESGRVALNIFLENSLKECDTVLKNQRGGDIVDGPSFPDGGSRGSDRSCREKT